MKRTSFRTAAMAAVLVQAIGCTPQSASSWQGASSSEGEPQMPPSTPSAQLAFDARAYTPLAIDGFAVESVGLGRDGLVVALRNADGRARLDSFDTTAEAWVTLGEFSAPPFVLALAGPVDPASAVEVTAVVSYGEDPEIMTWKAGGWDPPVSRPGPSMGRRQVLLTGGEALHAVSFSTDRPPRVRREPNPGWTELRGPTGGVWTAATMSYGALWLAGRQQLAHTEANSEEWKVVEIRPAFEPRGLFDISVLGVDRGMMMIGPLGEVLFGQTTGGLIASGNIANGGLRAAFAWRPGSNEKDFYVLWQGRELRVVRYTPRLAGVGEPAAPSAGLVQYLSANIFGTCECYEISDNVAFDTRNVCVPYRPSDGPPVRSQDWRNEAEYARADYARDDAWLRPALARMCRARCPTSPANYGPSATIDHAIVEGEGCRRGCGNGVCEPHNSDEPTTCREDCPN